MRCGQYDGSPLDMGKLRLRSVKELFHTMHVVNGVKIWS